MALLDHYDHQVVDAILGEKRQDRLASNTYAARPSNTAGYIGEIDIILHRTTVAVLFPNGTVHINSGRYRSKVTADRIRRCLPTGWALGSFKDGWILYYKGRAVPYQDDIYLHSLLSTPFHSY